jgi:secreted PhoX family phosphatase
MSMRIKMKNNTTRRKFLKGTATTGVALTLGATLMNLNTSQAGAQTQRDLSKLVIDPKGLCDLPAGFSYKVISKHGETMTDGHIVPDKHDGMGCFQAPNGDLVLVRNHEIGLYLFSNPKSPEPELAYDKDSSGGCTTIWLDKDMNVKKHYLSLTGTIVNCSGGKTPWNTWISCEEVDEGFGSGWVMGKRHGYAFEVDPFKPLQKSEPLKAMGRFRREAIAVDPQSGIVYQTEDNMKGCFYRFIPDQKNKLAQGGKLQALKFVDESIKHTSKNPMNIAKKYACVWVDIDEVDPEENTVSLQARAKGAAVFVRSEGIVAHTDGIYFACTAGGAAHIGQFFKYIPNQDNQTGTIELLYEAKDNSVMEKPDNIAINQWGDLIICEDNGQDKNCLIGLTPEGKHYYIAANYQSEWAGACFSPDGNTLFANIHKEPGMTVAIQGPWTKLRNQ